MTYGQIISILFVALLCYYAFLIVMDIQRAKAAEAAEQDNHVEEDIDISDEAQSFRPHKVSREEPKKEEEKKEDSPSENASESSQQDDASPTQSMPILHRKGKKKPKMSRRNQTIPKTCTMKLNLVLQLLHRQLNRITNRKQLLPNLLMMKRPRELLKNLLMKNHLKKAPMIILWKNNQKMTTNPTAHRPTAKPS